MDDLPVTTVRKSSLMVKLFKSDAGLTVATAVLLEEKSTRLKDVQAFKVSTMGMVRVLVALGLSVNEDGVKLQVDIHGLRVDALHGPAVSIILK